LRKHEKEGKAREVEKEERDRRKWGRRAGGGRGGKEWKGES
jgi:hypothetical protein